MGMNNAGQQRSFGDELGNWWSATPFFNKALILGSSVLFLVNILTKNILFAYMADYPVLTVGSFQIWRLFTAFMINYEIIGLIFCLISLVFESQRLEKVLGSACFFVDIVVKNLEIHIFYCLLMYFVYLVYPTIHSEMIPAFGLWDLVMLFITIRSASNPDQPTQFLCFPIIIKSKYYPFLIILLFSLISLKPFSLVSAMIIGYFEAYLFNGIMIRFTRKKAIWLENKIFRCFKGRIDFISAENLDSPYFQDQPGIVASAFNNSNSNSRNNNYMGGRGVVLGGNSSQQNAPPPRTHISVPSRSDTSQQANKGSSSSKPFSGKGTVLGSGTLSFEQQTHTSSQNDESGLYGEKPNKQAKIKDDYVNLPNESEEKKDKDLLD